MNDLEHTPSARAELKAAFGAIRWRVFLVCLLAWTLSNLDQALFGYAIPGLLAEFGLPLRTAGTILTVSFLFASLLVMGAGIAADRIGRAATLGLLLASSAFFVGLQGLAGGIVMLTVFRALGFGLSTGLSPITNSIIAETSPDRLRGLAMGLLQCGYPLGWLLASLLAAPLLDQYGWRAACFVAFLVVPVAWWLWWLLRHELPHKAPLATSPGTAPFGLGEFRELLSPQYRRNSISCAITFFAFGGAYAGSAFFFPSFFTQVRGYSQADAASIVGLSNGIAVIGYLGAAVVGEFFLTRRTTFALWCFGGASALVGLLWLADGYVADLVWFGLTAALFYGAIAVLSMLAAEIFPYQIRATALATCASAPLSLGFAVFPLIVPRVIERTGWEMGLTLAVLPLLLLSAASALLLPNKKSGEAIG